MLNFQFDEDFYKRVKHNFKLYILLSSKRIHWNEDDILDSIYRLNGYKCHKTVKYGKYSSHIHVKFEEEYMAKEAVEFLNKLNSDLTAILVDDMLRDWFTFEMRCGFVPPCTLTVVDIIGDTPLALNFLTSNILDSIFEDFGGPYLSPYTAAINGPHVQVLFGSMTEALAACMAFGEWHVMGHQLDSFYYRVRINPSNKEALLIRNSGGVPKEAFKLDYFISVRSELIPSRSTRDPEIKESKNPRPISSKSKGVQKVRKHKHGTSVFIGDPQGNFTNGIGFRTPIICLPIIAPINYTEAMMSTNQQLETDFVNTILNFQQSCSVSTRTIVASGESEIEISDIQYRNSEETILCGNGTNKLVKPCLPVEEEPMTKDPLPVNQTLVPLKQNSATKPKIFKRRTFRSIRKT